MTVTVVAKLWSNAERWLRRHKESLKSNSHVYAQSCIKPVNNRGSRPVYMVVDRKAEAMRCSASSACARVPLSTL